MIKTKQNAGPYYAAKTKLLLLAAAIFSFFCSTTVAAQTTLSPGDICIIGYYRASSTNAGFSFATLKRITKGTVIYFTDMGVNGATGWGVANEGYLKWTVGNTANQDLEAGAIISVVSPQTSTGMAVSIRTALGATSTITADFAASASPSGNFSQSSGGDPLLVFQTKSASKTFDQITDAKLPLTDVNFITAITTDYNTVTINPVTKWNLGTADGRTDGITSVQESTVPPGLTNGLNCISLGAAGVNENYAKFTGTLSGSRTEIMTRMNTASSWDATSATSAITLSSFTGNIALPVTFNTITAFRKKDHLSVSWSTSSEYNNQYFEIQGSVNGHDFIKIGRVLSKASDGNSDQTIDYSFALDSTTLQAFLGWGIIILASGIFLFSRRKLAMKPAGWLAMFVLLITAVACSKNESAVTVDEGQLFIRIAQVDKDGTIQYSKIVKVINE